MSNPPLISIIMPAYNAEKYVAEAIESVLAQSHAHFELLVINDGSTDGTAAIARGFSDGRIRYFEQKNQGVSATRNVGLANMNGDFFCFLDADDRMPPQSLSARLAVFEQSPFIGFVDGEVHKYSADFSQALGAWTPTFSGSPLPDLLALAGRSFFGTTWMVRVQPGYTYGMRKGLSHGEDLFFYMELARDARWLYAFTTAPVLHYRIHGASAMANLEGLEAGYRAIAQEIGTWPEVSAAAHRAFVAKTRRIMWKSYLRRGQVWKAIRALRP